MHRPHLGRLRQGGFVGSVAQRWGGNRSYSNVHLDERWHPEIIIKHGLRWVRPYESTLVAAVKPSWCGRSLLDVLTSNYARFPRTYWQEALHEGRVTLNGRRADESTIVSDLGQLSHQLHLHESPVSAEPIQLLHSEDNLLVINKPAGVPMHPVSMYRYNTVEYMLALEHGIKPIHLVSRLDMPTSGLVVIPRTPECARTMRIQFSSNKVSKKYYARVLGRFPSGPQSCTAPLQYNLHTRITQIAEPGQGKQAATNFTALAYDSESDTSIVVCEPLTGRSHQIRAHLRHLHHPIANDVLYGGSSVFAAQSTLTATESDVFPLEVMERVPWCWDCRRGGQHTHLQRVWLHAFSYTGPDWHFEAPPPSWLRV